MNHFTLSASVSSVCALVVAGLVLGLGLRRRVNQIAAWYWFSIGFWAFFVGSQFSTIRLLSPFWWGWLLHVGCTFIPVLMFHFALALTGDTTLASRRGLLVGYALTIVFNLLNLWTSFFTDGTAYRDAYAYPKPAIAYPLYFLLFVVMVVWGTVRLLRHLPRLPRGKQVALRILLLTHLLAYLGGMDNFLIMIDVRIPPWYPFGLYLIPPYAIAMAYAAWSTRLLEGVS